jgi:hypothetical protein
MSLKNGFDSVGLALDIVSTCRGKDSVFVQIIVWTCGIGFIGMCIAIYMVFFVGIADSTTTTKQDVSPMHVISPLAMQGVLKSSLLPRSHKKMLVKK